MKIVDFKIFVVGNPAPHHGGVNWIFLKLVTDDNIKGYGEAYGIPFHPHKVVHLIEDVCERFVIGSDPFQIEKLWRNLYSSCFSQRPDPTMMGVISAIEIACWDIVGKAVNQPIYNLLGGKVHERLRSYTYLYSAPGDNANGYVFPDADQIAERATEYASQGFTAVKFDPVSPMMPSTPQQISLESLRNAELMVQRVREAVGDRCDLLIGTHGQMTTSSAIRFAKRIEKYDPLWFEEPVPPCNTKEMARVANSTSIPVATGERLVTKYEFADLLEAQSASILQMALGRVGGILEAKKIAGMAEANFAQIAPHLYCGPIEAAANIQLDACTPNFLIQESIGTFEGFYADILTKPLQWEDGYIIPPSEPGLGVELNEELAEQHPFIEDPMLTLFQNPSMLMTGDS